MNSLEWAETVMRDFRMNVAEVVNRPSPVVTPPRPFDWDKAMKEAAEDGAIVDERAFYLDEYHE